MRYPPAFALPRFREPSRSLVKERDIRGEQADNAQLHKYRRKRNLRPPTDASEIQEMDPICGTIMLSQCRELFSAPH